MISRNGFLFSQKPQLRDNEFDLFGYFPALDINLDLVVIFSIVYIPGFVYRDLDMPQPPVLSLPSFAKEGAAAAAGVLFFSLL